jgi:hypothetical protein
VSNEKTNDKGVLYAVLRHDTFQGNPVTAWACVKEYIHEVVVAILVTLPPDASYPDRAACEELRLRLESAERIQTTLSVATIQYKKDVAYVFSVVAPGVGIEVAMEPIFN